MMICLRQPKTSVYSAEDTTRYIHLGMAETGGTVINVQHLETSGYFRGRKLIF